MKRNFTFLMVAFALMVGMMMPLGMKGQMRDEAVAYTLIPAAGSNNSYTDNCDITVSGITWNLTGNSQMVPWRLGGKSISDKDRELYSKSVVSNDNITKVVVTTGSATISVNSVKLVVSSNSNFSNATTLTEDWSVSDEITFNRPSGADWSNKYFKIVYNVTNTSDKNQYAQFVKAEFYKESTGTPCTITFNPGNGTCSTSSMSGTSGSSINLPTASPSTECANAGWSFAGWATQSISETTTAPTLLTGSYTISGNATLYAVYRVSDGGPASTTANMNFSSGSYSNSTITWTIPDIVSILQEKHDGQTAPNSSYVGSPRWYSGNKITITPSVTVTSISVTTTTEGYATALANSTYTNATATASDVNVTITPTNGSDAIVIVMGGQSRLSALSVSYASASYIYATAPSCSAQQQVATPTFSPAAGTYTEAQNVTISCTTSGATIHYTTDGTTPSTSSTAYSSPIPVSATTTIKAIAVKEGMTNSAVVEATYTINIPTPYTITFDPGNGTCATPSVTQNSGTSITLPTALPSAECANMGWTFAGWATSSIAETTTTPTLLTGSYTISGNVTLYAVYKDSDQQITVFNIADIADENGWSSGTQYTTITKNGITLTASGGGNDGKYYSSDETWRFYSSTNGTVTVTAYASNVEVVGVTSNPQKEFTISNGVASFVSSSSNTSFKSITVICGALTCTYATLPICMERVATPTFSPAAGSFDTPQNVTLNCATEDATIYYTTDGTAPTTSSSVYSAAINVSETTTIKAMAVKTDMANSEVATATYNIVSTINASESSFSFPYTASSDSFDFSVTNPVSGATVTATAGSWINPTVEGNTVSFDVAENHGDTRSGNITLNYISNGSTLATTTVTISQEANPNQPGTFERPYTVTEAWDIIKDLSNNTPTTDTVYVAGTISSINEVEVIQYHNATYYITDGNKTVKVQYGRNLDNTYFYEEDEIQVGDRVVVYGRLMKYNANTYEIAPYNYLVSLERDVEPPLFLPTSCMMANDEEAVVYLYTNNEEEVVIYYTTNGNTPTNSSEIYNDDSGISLQDITNEVTIKAVAYTLDGTKHSAVNSETYRMVSPNTHGLYNNPLTVQQALDSLDVSSTIEGVYVRGVVCADPEISLSNFMNANYYIADNLGDEDQLYVFRGRYYYGQSFSSQEELQYGDIVTVFGDLAIYNGQVKEFTAKNYIVEKERPSSVFIRPSEVTTNCRGISSSLNVYYNNLTFIDSSELQFCDAQGIQVQASTYGWLTASLNSSTGNIDFQIEDNDGNASRTAYLKLVVVDAGNSTPLVSNVVSITQGICSSIDFASLPFHYVGNGDAPVGITKVGLGENYGSSPHLKFDGVNDYMTLAFDEAPGELTFNIKGDQFKSSEFYLQTSTNNLDWDDLAIYTTQDMINSWAADNPKREIARVIGDPMGQSFPELNADVRYIRWIMMTHSSGSNVRLGEIHLYKPVIYYNIAVTQPTIEETQVGTITTSEMAQENETVNLSIEYNADDYYFVEWVVVDASGNPVAVTDNHFTMPASDVNVTATLVEANQPCTYAYSSNGTMGEQTEVTVGFVIDQMPSGDDITFNGQTFYFRGWTTDANDVTNLILAHSSYTVRQNVTFHAVYYQQVLSVEAEKYYAKVTRELPDWSGDYLIVYEDGKVAFDGGLETLDGVGNTISVTVSNGIITASETLGAAKFTIAARDGGYSIQSASGKFIGRNADSNELDENTEYDENYVNVISYDVEEGIDIVGLGGAHLRFNNASNQNRFRYFKSSTYTEQKPIQLYRYVVNVSSLYTRVFVDNPSGDIVIAGPSIVPNGSVLNAISITNDLGADRLVVEEGAQLVTSSNVDATIRKSINPYQGEFDNYYLISSPVNGQDPVAADMTDGGYDLYAFDQSAQGGEWQNYEANAFALQSGKGYLYANDYGGNIVMAGQMKGAADNVTITHVSGKNLAGWNLIGNPYPCNVTIGKPYYRLAEGGAALATDATDNSIAIAPMEGVFVYAEGEETVAFTKAPAISTTGSGRSTLNLRVSRNRDAKGGRRVEDNAIVRFGEGGLLRKLVLSPDLPQLYVTQDGTDYAIVNVEAEGELPVSFRAAEDGSYTLTVAAEGVSFNYLHLIDHKTGADVDLLAPVIARNEAIQEPVSYTFTAKTTDYASRFRLVFGVDAASGNVSEPSFAFFNGSQWIINNPSTGSGSATLQVVDMMGRVLSSQAINGHAEISIHEAQGVYLLRLLDGDSVKVQKIIIHN